MDLVIPHVLQQQSQNNFILFIETIVIYKYHPFCPRCYRKPEKTKKKKTQFQIEINVNSYVTCIEKRQGRFGAAHPFDVLGKACWYQIRKHRDNGNIIWIFRVNIWMITWKMYTLFGWEYHEHGGRGWGLMPSVCSLLNTFIAFANEFYSIHTIWLTIYQHHMIKMRANKLNELGLVGTERRFSSGISFSLEWVMSRSFVIVGCGWGVSRVCRSMMLGEWFSWSTFNDFVGFKYIFNWLEMYF